MKARYYLAISEGKIGRIEKFSSKADAFARQKELKAAGVFSTVHPWPYK